MILIVIAIFSSILYRGIRSDLVMQKCNQKNVQGLFLQNSEHRCRPRNMTLPIPSIVTGHVLLAPSHVEIPRCVGSCGGTLHHHCYPTKVKKVNVPVIMSEMSVVEGVSETVCGHVEMEEHVSCSCGCDVAPDTCNANQQFLEFECRCVCNNHRDRDTCLNRKWHWDRDTCTCQCPDQPYPTCPSSYTYDYLSTCSCILIHSDARMDLVTLLVLSSLGLTLSIVAVIGVYSSKTEIFRRAIPLFLISNNSKNLREHQELNTTSEDSEINTFLFK